MDKIKVLALGGLDEDGKDLYCIEVNDDIFVIGAGFKYPTRTTPGIDFVIADFDYLKQNKDRIKAYILPKAKKNSFGALPYIYKEAPAPIYCSILTKKFLVDFSEEYHQENDYKFNLIELPCNTKIKGHNFIFFSTCASMPHTFGFALQTDLGNIVYSGDFIVEYSNENYFKLDLNTLGKIAENPTLLLLSESQNCQKSGYCSPAHRIYPRLMKIIHEATGRVFIALNSDNLYHVDEVFKACNDSDKKIFLYAKESQDVYKLKDLKDSGRFNPKNILEKSDLNRVKESQIVIILMDENEKIYEKVSILANNENENTEIRITPNDTFYLAAPPTDNSEIICTSTVDELYKTNCKVYYETRSSLAKMHAYEEDLKMLLSLLKPKYYFPIEGYYVTLLANAKMAYEMGIGLSHNSIFLLDNGQSLNITSHGAKVDFNLDNKVKIGDLMIDGIGVGDVVNEIITQRNRLGEDGVVVLGCAISKSKRQIVAGPDIQMRGFLFLKDRDADNMSKEITKQFIQSVNNWIENTKTFDSNELTNKIVYQLEKLLLKNNNRNPVILPNILIID